MNNFLKTQWPIASVYAGLLASMLVVVWVDFRIGAILLALSVLWAFVLRWALPDASVGLLRIRRRRVDLTVLATLGTLLMVLALVVPHRR